MDAHDSDSDQEQGTAGNSGEGDAGDQQVIVLLDLACLETVKTKKGDFELLNCDDHIGIMKKHNKDPQKYRPDIVHQEILSVLDSPLNKAGKLKLYVHTEKNVLIEINPSTRIPRTFKRFSGLMVQLLHRLKIRSADGSDMLLKVVKNPISRHIPAGARCYGKFYGLSGVLSFLAPSTGFSQQGTLYSPAALADSLPDKTPIVLVFGAFAVGMIQQADHPYMQELVSISEYPLSGSVAINRVLGAIEGRWGIV